MLITECVYNQFLKTCGECDQDERRRSFSIESPHSLSHLTLKRHQFSLSHRLAEMGTKMKGFYKGFKYTLSQIFVVKEREMEIGYPTDVKHVAHIGWDGPSGTAPTWMNEFKTGPDFATTSIGNSGSALSPWSSQDFGESMRQQSESDMFRDISSAELSSSKKKDKRKKAKSTSSPKPHSSSSSRSSSRLPKLKSKFIEANPKPANIRVA